jgi:predicted nuclease of predicted toxin-antitoxin system
MRLFLDASVSPTLGDALATMGFDVVAQRSVLPLNSVDEDVLRAAWTDRRVVVARDYDMAELVLRGFAEAVAVVIIAFDLPAVVDEAHRVAQELNALGNKVLNAVVVIEPNRVRTRPFDLGQ